MIPKQNGLLLATLPLAVTSTAYGLNAQTATKRPNVILILADDMGYSGVSCFGGENLSTPNIDELYNEGVVCTNFHVAPVSSATRVSILTGSYQQRVGLNGIYSAADKKDGLDPQTNPAFVTQLDRAGYRTALYGKWHLGLDVSLNPTNHGFDDFRGFLIGNIDLVSHRDRNNEIDWWHNKELCDEPGVYATYLINNHSVEFIHESADSGEPFFLFVSHGAIHVPIVGPNDPTTRDGDKVLSYRNDTDMPVDEYRRRYREMVKSIDEGVGEIVEALRQEGILDETLIIFASDNGAEETAADKYPGANGYLHGYKGTTYEGGTRVPVIFRYPKSMSHNVTDELMNSIDLMPTILDLCGVENDRKIDGTSLLPTLEGNLSMPDRKIFCSNMGYLSLTDGEWKLVWYSKGAELYNILYDRNEIKDLAAKFPQMVETMKGEITAWWNDCTAGTRLEGTEAIPTRGQMQGMFMPTATPRQQTN